jgi:hypothetical protein
MSQPIDPKDNAVTKASTAKQTVKDLIARSKEMIAEIRDLEEQRKEAMSQQAQNSVAFAKVLNPYIIQRIKDTSDTATQGFLVSEFSVVYAMEQKYADLIKALSKDKRLKP